MESVRMRVTDCVADFPKQTSTTILRSWRQAALPLVIVRQAESELREFSAKVLTNLSEKVCVFRVFR